MESSGIFNIAQKVREILEQYPLTRDSDEKLTAHIWTMQIPSSIMFGSVMDFLISYSNGKYTSAESIRRSRQKLQEEYPHLRGKNWILRQEKLKNAVKQDVLNFKIRDIK